MVRAGWEPARRTRTRSLLGDIGAGAGSDLALSRLGDIGAGAVSESARSRLGAGSEQDWSRIGAGSELAGSRLVEVGAGDGSETLMLEPARNRPRPEPALSRLSAGSETLEPEPVRSRLRAGSEQAWS